MILRILTERKNTRWICEIVSEFFLSFTAYKATGYWHGQREKSFVIEIDTMNEKPLLLDLNVKMLVKKICGYNHQESVLIQKIESTSYFLAGNCR